MEQPDAKEIARHLRKPEGELGKEVALQLNNTNIHITTTIYACMEVKAAERILEIGFGNGKLMPLLLELAPSLFMAGIDFSEVMVDEARRYLKDYIERKEIEIKLAPVSNIPYADNTFDKICGINTLYFWDDAVNEAKEVLRVLKPGGSLYLGIRPKDEAESMPVTKFGFKLYDPQQAADLLKEAGFSETGFTVHQDSPFHFDGKDFSLTTCCVSGKK